MISSPHNSGLACKAYINYIILTPSVTEPLKEEILKGDVHTIEEMKAWLQSYGYSDTIKDATINAMLSVSRLDQRSTSDRHKQGNHPVRKEVA